MQWRLGKRIGRAFVRIEMHIVEVIESGTNLHEEEKERTTAWLLQCGTTRGKRESGIWRDTEAEKENEQDTEKVKSVRGVEEARPRVSFSPPQGAVAWGIVVSLPTSEEHMGVCTSIYQ